MSITTALNNAATILSSLGGVSTSATSFQSATINAGSTASSTFNTTSGQIADGILDEVTLPLTIEVYDSGNNLINTTNVTVVLVGKSASLGTYSRTLVTELVQINL
jgi:hypothetical protein